MRVSNGLDNGDNSEDEGKWSEFEKFCLYVLSKLTAFACISKQWGELLCKAESN